MSDEKLCHRMIRFPTLAGSIAEVGVVYEDTLPSGSSLGTVVTIHGAPGTHKDFKFIKEKLTKMGIRMIGINFPGFNYTPVYQNQNYGNVERQIFVNAFLDSLDLPGKMVLLGHSRGNENALMTAAERHAHGLVMISPIGFRRHKGIAQKSSMEQIEMVYNELPKDEADEMIFTVYKRFGFKVNNPEECISALRTMNRCSMEKQIEFVEKLNQNPTKVLFLFGGNDHLMEYEILFEAKEKYKGLKHFGASVFVKNDDHFQNKSRADLIAEFIRTILEQEKKLINKL
ncbi:unnamed protein product [Caenorhabditis bovis]|uniref:AB hydrolase-1 domain-containing protein n=1 Tax=Caenorhabditis bovis TaxID=2654633 RepID=A0A8S1EHD7_9PELO|nr:unnamed protein product [Caenorhabditis bovis]